MAKLTLSDIASIPTAAPTINANNTAIEEAIENTLSRDGSSPNQMEASLDMNSNRVINLPEPDSDTEPVRKGEFDEFVTDVSTSIEEIQETLGISVGIGEGDDELVADAADVSFSASGTVSAANVQDAIEELDAEKASLSHDHTIDDLTDITASAAELNILDGVTATTAEINYLGGATDNIQDQIDAITLDGETAAGILTKLLTVDGAASGLDADLLDGLSSAAFHQVGGTDVPVTDGGTGASTAAGARTALGLGSSDGPEFATIELGAASDTTLARSSAGNVTIEGNLVYRAGGTDVPITDGGTGASTAAAAATNLGLGTGDSPQFTGINVGHASDTTITRTGAGDIAVESNAIYRAGGTDVPVADGGTGASTASNARTNLGLVIDTDVQAYSAKTKAIADLAWAASKFPEFTGTGTLQATNIEYDIYTPTATLTTNLDGVTCNASTAYIRIGNFAVVWGTIAIDPTAAGATQGYITLPVASDFVQITQLGGVLANGIDAAVGAFKADVTNNAAQFDFVAISGTSRTYGFIFGYRIV